MSALPALLRKEVKALFSSPIAYALIAVFLLLNGFSFAAALFLSKSASLVQVFFQASILLVLIIPVITMRLFAEERRQGTLELLLTNPVSEIEIVLAKWLASLTVIVAMLAPTLVYVLILTQFSDPDLGPIYAGYVGLVLLSGGLLAIGHAVSAFTANQVVAATVALGIFLLLWMVDSLGYLLPDPFDQIVLNTSLLSHFTPFATGALYLSDLGFFIALTLFGLFLALRALERR
ncbi:MAG: ABC transporter permease subunit [Burkholderiales bacterium]|nr:ABC transporter permease subunit [Burkholderiales bacterium]